MVGHGVASIILPAGEDKLLNVTLDGQSERADYTGSVGPEVEMKTVSGLLVVDRQVCLRAGPCILPY